MGLLVGSPQSSLDLHLSAQGHDHLFVGPGFGDRSFPEWLQEPLRVSEGRGQTPGSTKSAGPAKKADMAQDSYVFSGGMKQKSPLVLQVCWELVCGGPQPPGISQARPLS